MVYGSPLSDSKINRFRSGGCIGLPQIETVISSVGEQDLRTLKSSLRWCPTPHAIQSIRSTRWVVHPTAPRRIGNCGRLFSPTRVNPFLSDFGPSVYRKDNATKGITAAYKPVLNRTN